VQPLEVMECRDGWIYVCCIEEHQWQSFVTLMGEPQWAKESIFSDRLQRAVNWDALRPLLQEWGGKQSVLDLYRQAQERRIPFAPVSSLGDLVNSEHLRARGFFAEIDHPVAGRWNYPGAPFCPQRTPWQIRSAAPILGQHNRDIFSGRLGLSISELGRLKEAGIV
jgi:crotonobetainyl-CoA:carnitine CoA-transferase CaiB-like acyl-CoA transferase